MPEEGVDAPARTGLPGPRPAPCTAPERLLNSRSASPASSPTPAASIPLVRVHVGVNVLHPAPLPLPPATRSDSQRQAKSRRKKAPPPLTLAEAPAYSPRARPHRLCPSCSGSPSVADPAEHSHLRRLQDCGRRRQYPGLGNHLPSVPPPLQPGPVGDLRASWVDRPPTGAKTQLRSRGGVAMGEAGGAGPRGAGLKPEGRVGGVGGRGSLLCWMRQTIPGRKAGPEGSVD